MAAKKKPTKKQVAEGIAAQARASARTRGGAKGAKKERTAKQKAATRKLVAMNKRRKGTGKKRKPGPTKFQAFLLRDPAAAKKKLGW